MRFIRDFIDSINPFKKPTPPAPPAPVEEPVTPPGPVDLTAGFFMGQVPEDVQVTYTNDVQNTFVDFKFKSGTIFRFICNGHVVAQISADGFLNGEGHTL